MTSCFPIAGNASRPYRIKAENDSPGHAAPVGAEFDVYDCLVNSDGIQSTVMVCLSVCLFALIISQKPTSPNFTKLYVACGRGSVLLWRSCDMLCTSGFVPDAFGSMARYKYSLCLNGATVYCIDSNQILLKGKDRRLHITRGEVCHVRMRCVTAIAMQCGVGCRSGRQ